MSRKLRGLFVGHPRAILLLRISGEGVFQQPRLFTTVDRPDEKRREGCGKIPGEKRNIVWRVLVVGLIRGKEV